ncbi:MAG: SPOR domain-containing protein [Niabella sp.]
MTRLFFLMVLFISSQVMAQQAASVSVYKDPRIDVLIKKQAEVNDYSTRNASKRRNTKGYRLLVASTSNRNDAIAARTKVLTYYPELKAYMYHQSPYFKVTAGNFLTRADAAAYQKRMNANFAGGVFIINATIEVKPEDIKD